MFPRMRIQFPPIIIYIPHTPSILLSTQNVAMSLPGLPGLGLDEPEEERPVETTQHDLAKEHEWRFEVAVGKYVQVKVSTPQRISMTYAALHCTDRFAHRS